MKIKETTVSHLVKIKILPINSELRILHLSQHDINVITTKTIKYTYVQYDPSILECTGKRLDTQEAILLTMFTVSVCWGVDKVKSWPQFNVKISGWAPLIFI